MGIHMLDIFIDRMLFMKLTEILSGIPFYETASSVTDIDINAIEIDSRKVKSGSLFVCINGFTVDGHSYVKQAIDNGAVAIVTEKKVASSVPTITVSDTSRALGVLAVKFYNNQIGRAHV